MKFIVARQRIIGFENLQLTPHPVYHSLVLVHYVLSGFDVEEEIARRKLLLKGQSVISSVFIGGERDDRRSLCPHLSSSGRVGKLVITHPEITG